MSASGGGPALAFVTTPRSWGRAWGRYLADHGPGQVVDLIAERKALFDRPYQLLVVDADSPLATSALVDELHRRGMGLVAVWDPAEPSTKQQALELGADTLIEADAEPAEFLRVVLDVAGEWVDAAPPEAVATGPAPVMPEFEGLGPGAPGGGQRTVVAGPVGTEPELVILELARALAKANNRVVVVDANDICPSLAQLVDQPLLPNLPMAVDALRQRGGRLEDQLLAVPEGRFWLVGGLADPAQWIELRPRAVVDLVDELAARHHHVLTQVGPMAENLADYGGDRFGVARAVLGDSDSIVAVGMASPVGMARLAMWLADVRLLAPETTLHLVLTRAPKDRFRRSELLERARGLKMGEASVHLLPDDDRLERAVWNGELVKAGPFRRSVADLATDVAAVGAGREELL
ncbi:MAG: MinD/ParA family ATP-binding protein [Acidimicrobiales bacterium]